MEHVLVSIVHNSISRDTRVIKEAIAVSSSLNIHYQIVGLADNNDSRETNVISERVVAHRIRKTRIRDTFRNYLTTSNVNYIELFKSFPFVLFIVLLTRLILPIQLFLDLKIVNKVKGGITARKFASDFGLIWKTYLRYFHFSYMYMPLLLKLSPTILHAHDAPMLVVAKLYKKHNPKCKIVFDAHEVFEHMSDRSQLFTYFFKGYIRKMSSLVDVFITINESIRDYHILNYQMLPLGHIIKNAAPASLLKNTTEKSDLIRKAISVEESKKILLYQGGYSEARGLDRVIDAMTMIDESWVLVFMGWGGIENSLKKKSLELGLLNKRVFFLPPAKLEELTAWTSGADVGIIPYLNNCLNHYFCTPNKLWEYPVARLPILVPNYPELSRVVDNFGIGWKINDMQPSSIAYAVNSISGEDISKKCEGIDDFFKEESWERYEIELASLYRKLMES